MIQIFIKSKNIKKQEWLFVYSLIKKVTNNFPLKLLRIESYDGFSTNLDKLHKNIIVNNSEENEFISFWGENFTCYGQMTVNIYKNFSLQIENAHSKEITGKPITWGNVNYKTFTGKDISLNGVPFSNNFFDTNYPYVYSLIAVGIILENHLPGRAILVINEIDIEIIRGIKNWCESILNEQYEMPVYLDKLYILKTLEPYYKTKTELVGRLDNLYNDKLEDKIKFAIENIGLDYAKDYYSKLLSNFNFGTIGFSDIVNAWIKATLDLEQTLDFIKKAEKNSKNKYNYSILLKDLLSQFILFDYKQKEILKMYFQNEKEESKKDIFELINIISGHNIAITPLTYTKQELFEIFMFFDPENANKYEKIINDWYEKNKDILYKLENEVLNVKQNANLYSKDAYNERFIEDKYDINKYTNNSYEKVFFEIALKKIPFSANPEENIIKLIDTVYKLLQENNDIQYFKEFNKKEKSEKIRILKTVIKQKRMYLTIGEDFENKIETTNDIIITILFFVASMSIYTKELHFARQKLFCNDKYWYLLEKKSNIFL